MLLAAAMFVFAACGDDDDGGEETAAAESPCEEASAPAPKEVALDKPPAKPAAKELTAVVDTSCGTFEIALDTKRNPKTAASFAYLAENGVYDGTPWHRIVPGFVIQGGDPQGTGTGGPGYFVDEKPPRSASYVRGVVAMAKSGAEPPGSAGSQFFVVTGEDAGLPPEYAIVGEVTEGMETVDRINALGIGDGPPSQPVVITTITAEES